MTRRHGSINSTQSRLPDSDTGGVLYLLEFHRQENSVTFYNGRNPLLLKVHEHSQSLNPAILHRICTCLPSFIWSSVCTTHAFAHNFQLQVLTSYRYYLEVKGCKSSGFQSLIPYHESCAKVSFLITVGENTLHHPNFSKTIIFALLVQESGQP